MLPASFKLSNRLLGAPLGHVPEESSVGEIMALPIWTDGEQSISRWRPTLRERVSILLFGNVWVTVWFGGNQPPIAVTGVRTMLKEAPPADKWLKRFSRTTKWSVRWERAKSQVQLFCARVLPWLVP